MRKQYLASVALKINVKVGGRNTVLVDTYLVLMSPIIVEDFLAPQLQQYDANF